MEVEMGPRINGLSEKLEKFSRQKGADLFGVADLSYARDFLISHCPILVNGYPRGVSIGMQLSDVITDMQDPNEPRRQSLYWHHVYDVVTPSLDFLAYAIARWLTDRGFKALPVPASTPYDFEKLRSIFPHKLAAHLAGLGWIGKSCLFLNDHFGPRVRLSSVLTDAPLKTGSPVDQPCGKCRACVDACPVKAFTGAEFRPEDGREVRFDVFKCSEYRKDHPCGACVAVCPQGKRRGRQEKAQSR